MVWVASRTEHDEMCFAMVLCEIKAGPSLCQAQEMRILQECQKAHWHAAKDEAGSSARSEGAARGRQPNRPSRAGGADQLHEHLRSRNGVRLDVTAMVLHLMRMRTQGGHRSACSSHGTVLVQACGL